jgi:hypothetical protein
LLLHCQVNSQHRVIAIFGRGLDIVLAGCQRHAIGISYRLDLSRRTLQLLVQSLFNTILSIAVVVDEAQQLPRQAFLRINPVILGLRAQAWHLQRQQTFILVGIEAFSEHDVARLFGAHLSCIGVWLTADDSRYFCPHLVRMLNIRGVGVQRVELLVEHDRHRVIAVMRFDNAARRRYFILLQLAAESRRLVVVIMNDLHIKQPDAENSDDNDQ